MIIRIKNLKMRTIVGIYPREKKQRQPLIANIKFEFNADTAVRSDSFSDTVDYEHITNEVKAWVEKGKFDLIETVADGILRIVMKDPRVERALVEVDKPKALKTCESVSASAYAQR